MATGLGIVLGLAIYGHHTMETIGKKLTKLEPSKAFSVNFASTLVILGATKLGICIVTRSGYENGTQKEIPIEKTSSPYSTKLLLPSNTEWFS